MAENQEMSEIFEVNNQLGSENNTVSQDNIETGAWGQHSSASNGMLQLIMEQIAKQSQNFEEQFKKSQENFNEQFKKTREEINNKLDSTNNRLEDLIRTEISAVRADLREQSREFNNKLEQQRKEFDNKLEATEKRLESIDKNNSEIRSSLTQTRKELKVNTENNNKKFNELHVKVGNVEQQQEKLDDKLNNMAEEKGRKIEEITSRITNVTDTLSRRIDNVEVRPLIRPANEAVKDVTYNGTDPFPIEFLRELDEIKETYYNNDNINWIKNHLISEAAIWWRIVRQKVRNYTEFRKAFTDKYWCEQTQQAVLHNLEYGKYRPSGTMNMIEYVEQKMLQCRQLIPAVSEQHIIKKLARHFNRNVEFAVLTRGIQDLNAFEILLREFTTVCGRDFNKSTVEPYNGNQVDDTATSAHGGRYSRPRWPQYRENENQPTSNKYVKHYDKRRQEHYRNEDADRKGDHKPSKGIKTSYDPKIQAIELSDERPTTSYAKNERFITTQGNT